MSARRHAFVVTHHFPPLGGIASARARRSARMLHEFGQAALPDAR